MKYFLRTYHHIIFRIGVIMKLIDGTIEIVLGVAVYFISYETLNSFLASFVQDELAEGPRDILWGYVLSAFHGLSTHPNYFWALLLLGHGVPKLFMVAGLLKNKLWAYPASVVVFALFVAYQAYEMVHRPAFFLGLLTAFDIVLIGLIYYEYTFARAEVKRQ